MRLWLMVACFITRSALATTATTDLVNYQNALNGSLADGASVLADPFAKAFAFSTGTQTFSPVAAKGLMHFNLGVGLGVNSTPIAKGTNKAAASLPDALPIPLGTINGHVGLPGFFIFESIDLGLRFGSISASTPDINVALTAIGAEFRGNVFEAGLVAPVTLTLGLGYDQLKSDIGFRKDATLNDSSGGFTHTGAIKTGADVSSTIGSTSLKASVSRKFLFFTPYLGAALQVLSGDTKMTAFQKGTITSTDNVTTATATQTSEGSSVKAAPVSDLRLGAGFEISMVFVYLTLGGEYGVQSGGAGGNAQLGLQF